MELNEKIEKPAPRVSILDARDLDNEIHGIIKNQFSSVISYLPPGTLSKFEPELDVLIRILIWKVSVDKNLATFGQQLLSLRYGEGCTRNRLRLYGILLIGSLYLKERLTFFLHNIANPKLSGSICSSIDNLEAGLKIFNILTLIVFLRSGKGSTFLERVLQLTPVSTRRGSRSIGYSFMTRELIWHGFVEMFGFMLPLVNYHSVRRQLRNLLKVSIRQPIERAPCIITKDTRCSFCKQVPVIPHHMGCSHIFCYYCLSANRLADSKFECPDCDYSDPNADAMKPVLPLI